MAAPRIVVLTAPSGAGKTTVARRVLEVVSGMSFSVSATTRARRAGECDGVDYHFLSVEEFVQLREEGGLVESEEVYAGRHYGTLGSELDRATRDEPILLDIDVKGALRIKERYGSDALAVFISPPTAAALRARLLGRGTETEAALETRLRRAEFELTHADRFDAVVVNDELERAVEETIGLIHAFLEKTAP